MIKTRLAVIGNGLATGRLLDELMRRGAVSRFEIQVFGEEPHGLYNRILIGRILGGGTQDEITLKPTSWYAENDITFHPGVLVDRVDPARRVVETADGEVHPYDVAVFATGSRAFIPPMDGLRGADGKPKPGIFAYRTIDDGRRIRDHAQAGSRAIVLGGGLLGLEAAKSLVDLGVHVTVVQPSETLMEQQVDALGGQFLRRAIERLGIEIASGVGAAGVVGEERIEAIKLSDGRSLPADLLVLACGIRPRVDAAAASGLKINRGILVDDRLGTSEPGVYAVGECAEHDGQVYGIVEPIYEQCAVLADVLAGTDPKIRYRGSKSYTRLKVAGVGVASMGLIRPATDADEVIQIIEERTGTYRKLIVRDDRLVGAVLVGETSCSPDLARWLDRGDPLPVNRVDVLCSGGAFAASADPEICNCHHVRESTLVAAIQDGRTNLNQIGQATRAGTGCGSCRGQIAHLLTVHAKPAAVLSEA
ncbi:FAD-dependent oxidoreductase [Paludisphaera borealis]|uniref:Nitrite reductase [NAD(P)H] n=1 Tax=Paludisphaera borealis TaxID=1387353 RepID=A0A1U7CL19_9BACT|nr:FAD-dependent oxidoreductase [Paludisphaera borealis]APW59606.1 Nitrite reductase [NAD(P)H] [Paludisphaera borealis]